jgi:hypothetical protein
MVHVWPGQQSLGDVHAPPVATHVGPVELGGRQRSVPVASGTQGVPPQHSEANAHCWPAAMQHGATPV